MNAGTAFFLGANTCSGFCSGFDGFTREKGVEKLYVIKGGPGCGKSSFMRSVAEAAAEGGLAVEVFYCSGDPDSLDGVFLPELGTAYVDGTAPHVLEPASVGVTGNYLSFAEFYDGDVAPEEARDVLGLTKRYKEAYASAYRALAAYGALTRGSGGLSDEAVERARERVRILTKRTLGRGKNEKPQVVTRWLEAFTCAGRVFLADTILQTCGTVVLLDNASGLARPALETCAEQALACGHDVVRCPDALFPERLDAVLVPSASCAFLASNAERAALFRGCRHVRLDSLARRFPSDTFCADTADVEARLLRTARSELARAKSLHDALEEKMNPHVDFSAVYALAERHAKALLAC